MSKRIDWDAPWHQMHGETRVQHYDGAIGATLPNGYEMTEYRMVCSCGAYSKWKATDGPVITAIERHLDEVIRRGGHTLPPGEREH